MGLTIAVLVGSVRSDRQGIKAARFVERSLATRGHQVTVVDPVALNLPILDRMFKEYPAGQAPPALDWLAALYRSDGRVCRRQRRVQPQHPTGIEQSPRPLPRGILLPAVGDRLLFVRRVRRRPRRDATARHALRAGHAEHLEPVSYSARPGRFRRSGETGRRRDRATLCAIRLGARMVRGGVSRPPLERGSLLKHDRAPSAPLRNPPRTLEWLDVQHRDPSGD